MKGMTLEKGNERDVMMLAQVKEQDGIMLAYVKVPSIPTSVACCDDVQLTNAVGILFLYTFLQLSTTLSDYVLLK